MFWGVPNLAERAPNVREKSRGSGGKSPEKFWNFHSWSPWKCTRFQKLGSSYVFHLCKTIIFQLRTWLECGWHRFLWQQTASRRDYKPQSSAIKEFTPPNRVLLSTGQLKRVFGYIRWQTLIFPTPDLFFDTSKTRKSEGWCFSNQPQSVWWFLNWVVWIVVWNLEQKQ